MNFAANYILKNRLFKLGSSWQLTNYQHFRQNVRQIFSQNSDNNEMDNGVSQIIPQILQIFTENWICVSKKPILMIYTRSDPNSRRRQDPILCFPSFVPKTPFWTIFFTNFRKKSQNFYTIFCETPSLFEIDLGCCD